MNKKNRVLDVNELALGSEPEPDLPLGHKLNWYAAAKNCEIKKQWALEYFDKRDLKLSKQLSKVDKQWFATLGSICRVLSRGGDLGLFERQSFDKLVDRVIVKYKPIPVKKPKSVNLIELSKKMEPLNNLYDKLDDMVDRALIGEKYTLAILEDGLSNSWIIETLKYYNEHQRETKLALTDEELSEGYQSKAVINRLIKVYDDIDTLLNQYIIKQKNLKALSNKSRKTKPKSTDKMIEKLQYLKSDKATNLISTDARKLVGAKRLFVYNVKTRKLALYIAIDDTGFSVKGTTLMGFSEKSYTKTVRKPAEFFRGFIGVTLFKQTKQMQFINSVEGKLTGRINKDCILVSCK